ncbi:GNAT family N-acetyltransferase [Roseovarius aestuariivivens]|uniref:GNAT family N-acetyltransferase n=1 Tax=Roseovarius aestuariivivens TaxID=1888910 RepID=UPI0010814624|nr:GNAT family N-acetyltransferase [Roseovarius aestuariivivens]
MTGLPGIAELYAVTEATWPPAATRQVGAWTIRNGQGGGKRVSAATLAGDAQTADLAEAEAAMQALGQSSLFMLRDGEGVLDDRLDNAGYDVIDPVNAYACPLDSLTGARLPRVTTFDIWEPMAIQLDIWKAGGIGPARIEVMRRVREPKTTLFGRHDNRPAATGFVAVHDGVAMIHALEVLARARRAGMGRNLTRHAAHWAKTQGATHLAVLCTKANTGANALYASLGMTLVGEYHYRIKKDASPR